MLLPNRHHNTPDYRYGFQGQEMDDEIKGEGNSLNYKYRMHDPRVGRFFAVDPLAAEYPDYSPYSFAGNKVIAYKELEGMEELIATLDDSGMPILRSTGGRDLVKVMAIAYAERIGNDAVKEGFNMAVNRLAKGELIASNGKVYSNAKRMRVVDEFLLDGSAVKNLKRAHNIGWKKGGELVTTKAVSQLEGFLNIGKAKYLRSAGRFLGNIGLLVDIASTVEVQSGEINPFKASPIGFIADQMHNGLKDFYLTEMSNEFNASLDKGAIHVQNFISNNSHDYTMDYEQINVSGGLMKKILSGSIRELGSLYDAVSEDYGSQPHSVIIEHKGDKSEIRAFIIKDTE
ncbi:MAG: hypothetical protein COB98_09910 [Flavobacteriaceae bacterium]|nr:MAG: hypothetical protein COB98_09910 [Flavobacteriaceae bacterium]